VERPWKRLLGGGVCAAAGLLATSAALSTLLDRWPEVRQTDRTVAAFKTRTFERRRDEFDLAFVGSSHVLQGFDPGAFDQELASAGLELRSFNLGFNGMWLLELIHVVDRVLAQRPARLRWLLIEPRDIDVNPVRLNALTDREVDWHVPWLTLEACRAAWQHESPLLERLEVTGLHLRALSQRLGNVGAAWRLLQRRPWVTTQADALPYAGYGSPWSAAGPGAPPQVRGERVRTLAREPGTPRRDDPSRNPGPEAGNYGIGLHADGTEASALWLGLLADLVARVRAAGIEPLFVVTPDVDPRLAHEALERGVLPALLDYSHSIPEIEQAPGDWFASKEHLNPRGAQLFSRLLARDLATRLAAPHPVPGPR